MSQNFNESERITITRWNERDGSHQAADYLAQESPIALVFNGISHAVMMMTPSNIEQFVVGFSLTEGIIDHVEQIYDVEVKPVDIDGITGFEVMVEIASSIDWRLKQQKRVLSGRTGCGLCGTDSLEHAMRPVSQVKQSVVIQPEIINNALAQLQDSQILQQQTGAVHAAAWFSVAGELLQIYEDVGRHNALDKLIGHMAQKKIDPSDGFLLMSSRGSYEIIHKAAAAGIGNVVTISAPTALARKLAEAAGIKLVGFARPGRHAEY
ncbi:formate dehydrogenase accessory sulfurtransferase FdhD [Sessilibacter corallicola]|uniref:formate dehydrogenase accessory sulfurtransferase FdhD n=1 Tax=Sessilibacter corallicola TaxID=2904075 RepID=UPI001E6299F9|nr:formate dehydrogenase accessory sulfurtransferase FdhD [Sessilibacter corallicola]MCE2029796.1 formate dehydrogenase accessory sulfurtransferase FdhD [Sessilibacter corallicola]